MPIGIVSVQKYHVYSNLRDWNKQSQKAKMNVIAEFFLIIAAARHD